MWWRGKKIKTAQSARSAPQAEIQLEKIKQLKRELNDITNGNDAENHRKDNAETAAASLRSEIFRKLSILQVLCSCPSQSSKTKRRSWKDILRLNKFGASPEKEEGKCGALIQVEINDYLQQIINANARGRVRTVLKETFPFYWLLPAEMREQILMRVESPGDKLNAMAALPQDSTFLKKDLSRLLCEVQTEKEALLKTSELTKEQSCAIDKDNINYLKEWMSQDSEVEMLQTLKMVDCRSKWRNISRYRNPISVTVALEIDYPISDKFPNLEKQLDLLKSMNHCGVSIWKCYVDVTNFPPEGTKPKSSRLKVQAKLFGYLCNYLRQMPELRYLEFYWSGVWLHNLQQESKSKSIVLQHKAIKHMLLPELPHLRYLGLNIQSSPRFISDRVLEKYGPQLKLLVGPFANEWVVMTPKLDSLVELRCTFLASDLKRIFYENDVQIQRTYFKSSLPYCAPKFHKLSSSPIKYIHLDIMWTIPLNWMGSPKMVAKVNFAQLMCSLNCFGGTLEKLRLEFANYLMLIGNENQEWIGSLRLPKLKVFDLTGFPGEWSFLLQFPCLETLTLCNNHWKCPDERYFPASGIPKLSWNLEKMCESSLWELFPHLDWVVLKCRDLKENIHRISRTLMEKVRRLTAHKRMELL